MESSLLNKVIQKPYVYITIFIFFVYLVASTIFSGFYNTIPFIIKYAATVSWVKLALSILFTLVIGFLVALNTTYIYINYKERKQCKEAKVMTSFGAVSGLAVGICPLCVTGLFPLILGLFGVSFTFAALPFEGLEVQALVILLLTISLLILNKKK